MDFKEAFEKLQVDQDLAKSLMEAIRRNADASELSEILAKAGIAAEDVENLISEYQRRRGLAIADDDLDEEMLRKVAGGGTGTSCSKADDCDSNFKLREYWSEERCIYQRYCDEEYEY